MRRPWLIVTATLAALWGAQGATQPVQPVENGVLLAAAPNVTGFRFERSIVFVVHHDDNGSLGLIVNRPTRLSVAETFDELEGLDEYEGRVYVGGPLEPTRPLLLLNDAAGVMRESEPVFGSIHVVASTDLVRRYAERLTSEATLRVYAGHIRWEPGQLQAEVAAGNWRVLPGSVEAVFADEPLELYRGVGADGSSLHAAAGAR